MCVKRHALLRTRVRLHAPIFITGVALLKWLQLFLMLLCISQHRCSAWRFGWIIRGTCIRQKMLREFLEGYAICGSSCWHLVGMQVVGDADSLTASSATSMVSFCHVSRCSIVVLARNCYRITWTNSAAAGSCSVAGLTSKGMLGV